MLGQDQSRIAKQSNVKQRHPGFTVSNDTIVTPGRSAKPQEVVISPAVKQLNKDGYVVYNTPEKQDIYVTVQPDSAFFEEEEPRMVRMAGGSFVSGNRNSASVEVPIRSEPEPEPIEYAQPADIFANAARREELEEIDFNEIIIKKNESFEEEIGSTPELFTPYTEVVAEPVFRETVVATVQPELAQTSSAAVEAIPEAKVSYMGYREEPEYIVEESQTVDIVEDEPIIESAIEDVVEMTVPVTDVPSGLYVDGYRTIDVAEADVEETAEMSSFIEPSLVAEMAETSEAALPSMFTEEVSVPLIGYAVSEGTGASEIMIEDTSETIAELPVIIEVVDPVADIMKLTVPTLHMSDDLLAELSKEDGLHIPDDGLEAYDDKFIFVKIRKAEVNDAPTMSFGFERPVFQPGLNTSVNFRF